jgi:hypothetical protein
LGLAETDVGTHGDPDVVMDEQEEIKDEDGDEEEAAEEVVSLDAEDAAAAWEVGWWNVALLVVLVR